MQCHSGKHEITWKIHQTVNMKKQKKRYVVYYTGILEWGYVTFVWRKPKEKTIVYPHPEDAIKFATKFRFKWFANFVRWNMERSSEGIRCFEVHEYLLPNADDIFIDSVSVFMDPVSDEELLEIYETGWHDALSPGKTWRSYPTKLQERAYKLGGIDARAGDDVTSIDFQTDEEILKSIKN